MATDVWTVLWRDLRGFRAQFENRRKALLGVAASLVFLIIAELTIGIHDQIGDVHPALLIWIWCWLPLGSAITLSTDAIAGERERHTLESLLATRIPAHALLIGKILSITIQAWISALLLALGAVTALNAALIWHGEFFTVPWVVLLIGPSLSFLLTMLGTVIALLISMGAPTVRQANFRIIIATSFMPVFVLVPALLLLFLAILGFAFLAQLTSFQIDRAWLQVNSATTTVTLLFAYVGLAVTIGVMVLITALRFTRERLLRVAPPTDEHGPAEPTSAPPAFTAPRFGFALGPAYGQHDASAALRNESTWMGVVKDTLVVAWKELVEVKGMAREWSSWIAVIGFVLVSMIVQVSIITSWYWAQDADLSVLYWMAMAGALPLLIAQRSADAIAGERERHTGEILFTTRLSHTGIVLGKLCVTALLPWAVLLVIPVVGLLSTNLIQVGSGPHFYPPVALISGLGVTLGLATLFAAGGMLVSVGAPTVQHAARRISWFVMPVLIAPGLALRSSLLSTDLSESSNLEAEGTLGLLASGDFALYALATLPILALLGAGITYVLLRRFRRGSTVFD